MDSKLHLRDTNFVLFTLPALRSLGEGGSNAKWSVACPAWNPLFVLGIVNSKLISYLYINTSSIATKDDFRQTTLAELRSLPIPSISLQNAEQKAMHDKMAKLVERMLDLHKKLAAAKIPDEKTQIQRQGAATDNQIDQMVYKLYNLTPDEIAIVEKV